MSDLIGKTIGKYRIVARLGRGGMAEVYKAYHPGLDRYVAIKVLHSHLADDEDFIGRFEREARAVANLRHSNIVQVFDFDVQDRLYYMAMEFVDGPTLKAELKTRSQKQQLFSLEETTRIIAVLCDAIDYAHQHGMIHRDLKPANFILNQEGQILILDFGIAKIVGATQYTVTGAMAGTPTYMSPEQGQGERGDERSDIYSLGVVLYEMATGRVPFEGDTPFAVIMKHISDPLPSPRSINPDIPKSVEAVILKALSKNPAERYQTGSELATALKESIKLSAQDTLLRNPVQTIAPMPHIQEIPPDDAAFTPIPTAQINVNSAQTTTPPGTSETIFSSNGLKKQSLLLWGGIGAILLLIIVVGALVLFGLNQRRNVEAANADATAVAENQSQVEQTATEQALQTVAKLAVTATFEAAPTEAVPTETATAAATETPSPTPDLDATIAARLTATAILEATQSAKIAATQTAAAPTVTPTQTQTTTPVPTDTPLPKPTTVPATAPPIATSTPVPPQISGKIAIPLDDGGGRSDVHIFDIATGNEINVIIGARQPSYRDDGQLLVNGDRSPRGEGAGDNIFQYNADGSSGIAISGSPDDGFPVWGPDGGRIAYDNRGLVRVEGSTNEWHLFVQPNLSIPNTNDMASFNVIEGNIFDTGQPLYPVWASDDYLIFHACDIWPGGHGGATCAVWRTPSWATAGGTGFQAPARVVDLNGMPTDTIGGSLLVMSRETGNWDVYITGIGGGGATNLTNNAAQDGLGAFSPDGKWVAFISNRDGAWGLWTIPSGGGTATKMFNLPGPLGSGEHDWTRDRIAWGP